MMNFSNERLSKQIDFLIEIDAMKNVLRQTLLADGSRRENDAEHSWHFAVMAMILQEYAYSPDVDISRVLKMALVHDLIEVYAGDTFCYDDAGNSTKEAREREAADKLFGKLPAEQGAEIRALWEEFDAMETPDAIYAASIDRIQPLINNYLTQGHTWKKGNVTSDKVYKRMEPIRTGMPQVWEVVEFMITDSIRRGFLKEN